MQIIKVKNLGNNYSILIGNNTLKYLPIRIKSLCPSTKKIALIFDKNVPLKHKKIITRSLKSYELVSLNFNPNEKTKSM